MVKSFQLWIFVRVSFVRFETFFDHSSNRLEPELSRSRSARDEHRNRSNQTRSTPTLQHSFSTSASALRASKLQSHILHRFHHLHNQLSSSSSSSNAAQETRSAQSVIDRLLFDFHSLPNHLFNGKLKRRRTDSTEDQSLAMESEDSESLRAAISETISQLANQSSEGDDTVRMMKMKIVSMRLMCLADAGCL